MEVDAGGVGIGGGLSLSQPAIVAIPIMASIAVSLTSQLLKDDRWIAERRRVETAAGKLSAVSLPSPLNLTTTAPRRRVASALRYGPSFLGYRS